MDLNFLTYIGVGIAVIILILVFFLYKPKKSNVKTSKDLQINDTLSEIHKDKQEPSDILKENSFSKVETVSKEGTINAVIFDDTTRSYGRRHVEIIKDKDYGRPVLYLNNLVFLLHKTATGQIIPVSGSKYTQMEHSPSETFQSVKNMEDIRMLFGKQNPSDKFKLWLFILGALAALFIAWMAVQSRGG